MLSVDKVELDVNVFCMQVKKASSQSYDQLLQSLAVQTPEGQGQMTEDSDSAETQRMMDSGSGCGEGEVVEDTEATVLAL